MQAVSAMNLVKCTIRASPLPKEIWDFLRDNLALLRRMQQEQKSREETGSSSEEQVDDGDEDEVDLQGEVIKRPSIKVEDFWTAFQEVCAKAGGEWIDLVDKVWAFGPQRAGTCVLADWRAEGQPNS